MANLQPIPTIEDNLENCVYMATNNITGLSYIGKTKQRIKDRINTHRLSANHEKPSCVIFGAAIQEFGFDSFNFQILAHCEPDNLNATEYRMIAEYNTVFPNGYNLIKGGLGLPHKTPQRIHPNPPVRIHVVPGRDLPSYVRRIDDNPITGYVVALPPPDKYVAFCASVFTDDEQYDYAMRYFNASAEDRILIHESYLKIKAERKRLLIMKEQHIDGEIYYLPSNVIWTIRTKLGTGMFVVKDVVGHPRKEFGNSKLSIRENYNRAMAYYDKITKKPEE